MKIRSLLALTIFVAHYASVAHAKCIPSQEFQPRLCSINLPPVSAVQIESNGVRTLIEGDDGTACRDFKLTKAKVRRFLSRAMKYEESQGHYTLSSSTCASHGKVVFADGRSGIWHVGNLREGWLKIDGGTTRYLYCPTCGFKPFIE
jgi:hypothetical protein